MTFTQNAKVFRFLLSEIRRKRFIKFVSYPLTVIYVGIPIRKWANRELHELDVKVSGLIKEIEREVETRVRITEEKDTYLIYHQLQDMLSLFKDFLGDLQILHSNTKLLSGPINRLVDQAINNTKNRTNFIRTFNENFIERRKVKYGSLWRKSAFPLDDDQLTAVIRDDKHNLIVAGAGSGKTEVLITRIAYLVNRSPDTIKPEKILALAFQNKAAEEIRERLQQRFGVDVKVKTFHALGNEILQVSAKQTGRQIPKLKFSGDNFEKEFRGHINGLFNRAIEDPKFQNNLINYMKYYGEDQIVRKENDFKTKEEFYMHVRGLTYTALDGTKVKSEGERDILNFFISHKLNGKNINILYEAPASWMKYETEKGERIPKPDFFFPEFNIYLEHWALNRRGQVPEWFGVKTQSYKKSMEVKKKKYKDSGRYKLIETYSWEHKQDNFLKILEKRFTQKVKEKQSAEKIKLERLDYCDLVEKVWDECKKSTKALPLNVGRFIVIAKTYSLTPEMIAKRLKVERWTPKQEAFARIALKIYQSYEQELHTEGSIDFADMINIAVKELRERNELYRNEYEHILIDEYQDISTQRYELIKELMGKSSGCKLFCVGDDWQSIMGFAGANLDFFVRFDKYFDHPARTDLTMNYRSIKSVVETGALIIKHNRDAQLQKETVASNPRIRKIKVYAFLHEAPHRKNYFKQMAHHCVDRVGEYLRNGYQPKDIMILTRIVNNPMLTEPLLKYAKQQRIPIGEEGNKRYSVPFMSVHRSKGLQARVVFILGVDKDLYGFPCELENPDIFDVATIGKGKDKEEEERRLFYVAVTRAKEEVYIYNQESAESKFLVEISNMVEKEKVPYFEKAMSDQVAACPSKRQIGFN